MNNTIQTVLLTSVSVSQSSGKPIYSAVGGIQNYQGEETPVSVQSRSSLTAGTLINIVGDVSIKKAGKTFLGLNIWAKVVQVIDINGEPENLNQVNLVGRIGSDPEIKWFESGKCLCTVPIIVETSNAKGADSDWFNLKIWGEQGENFRNIVKSGSLISLEGELDVDSWTDKVTGEIRSRPIVKVNSWDILSTPTDSSPSMEDYELPEQGAFPIRGFVESPHAAAELIELVDQIPF